MAFPWPGQKKEVPVGVRPEFPAALEAELPAALPSKADNPLKSAARNPAHGPVQPLGHPGHPLAGHGSGRGENDPLPVLTERLETLGRMLDEAKEQVTSYLLHRESQSGADDNARALARKMEALAEKLEQGGGRAFEQKLDALYGKIDQLAGAMPGHPLAGRGSVGDPVPAATERPEQGGVVFGPSGGVSEEDLKASVRPVVEKIERLEARLKSIDALKDALVPAITKLRDAQTEQHNTQSTAIRQLAELVPQYFNALPQYFTAVQQQVVAAQHHADAGLRAIIDILRPPQTEAAEPATVAGDWQEALLGGELARNPALNADKNRLLSGVLGGDPGACGLIGSLLQFRAAAATRKRVTGMPPLLKDIGEAFYRWQPKTSSKPSELEKAMVAWLVRACEQAGMANTIELVSPGERFDSLRHNAPRPGVEITQVLGWIVLRDNGKVYTKASVAVK